MSSLLDPQAPYCLPNLTLSQFSDLQSTRNILQLLHHRSRSQHRRSAWYRHFNTFRRQLRQLLYDLDPVISVNTLPSQKSTIYQDSRKRAEQLMQFWMDVMVEKWYISFRQLTKDSQFAVLGLVLLSTLGRVVKILGLLAQMTGSRKSGLGGKEMAVRFDGAEERAKDLLAELSRDELNDTTEYGVAVERVEDAYDGDVGIQIERPYDDETTSPPVVTPVEQRSARPKGDMHNSDGDDIDDIFAGIS